MYRPRPISGSVSSSKKSIRTKLYLAPRLDAVEADCDSNLVLPSSSLWFIIIQKAYFARSNLPSDWKALMTLSIVLSYIQAEPLLKAKGQGQHSMEISPDLGLTTTIVTLTPEGVVFPQGERLDWQSIAKISNSKVNCYVIENDTIRPVQVFSEY